MFKLTEQPIAKKCAKCKKMKPINQYCVDNSKKDGLYSSCKSCKNKKNRDYKKKNASKVKAYNIKYRKNNKDKISIISKSHYEANKEKRLALSKVYRLNNKDKCIKWGHDYYMNHKVDWYNKKAERRSLKNSATVFYSDKKAIKRIYRTAHILGIINKCKYEVDHIIPLKHPLVCGLHHEDNLQIITMRHNRRKHNRFDPKDYE